MNQLHIQKERVCALFAERPAAPSRCFATTMLVLQRSWQTELSQLSTASGHAQEQANVNNETRLLGEDRVPASESARRMDMRVGFRACRGAVTTIRSRPPASRHEWGAFGMAIPMSHRPADRP